MMRIPGARLVSQSSPLWYSDDSLYSPIKSSSSTLEAEAEITGARISGLKVQVRVDPKATTSSSLIDSASCVIVADWPRVIASTVLFLFQEQIGSVPSLAREFGLMKFEHEFVLKVMTGLEKDTIILRLLASNLADTSLDL
jgi:hypothetical protein